MKYKIIESLSILQVTFPLDCICRPSTLTVKFQYYDEPKRLGVWSWARGYHGAAEVLGKEHIVSWITSVAKWHVILEPWRLTNIILTLLLWSTHFSGTVCSHAIWPYYWKMYSSLTFYLVFVEKQYPFLFFLGIFLMLCVAYVVMSCISVLPSFWNTNLC
jgi:hypothetical protein